MCCNCFYSHYGKVWRPCSLLKLPSNSYVVVCVVRERVNASQKACRIQRHVLQTLIVTEFKYIKMMMIKNI